jgi:phosphoenolpyruvate carboxykinase (ATP)
MKAVRAIYNPTLRFLYDRSLEKKEAVKSATGTLVVYTGRYTGRSPNDKYIVDTKKVHNKIHWGKVNVPISSESYDNLHKKLTGFFEGQEEFYIVEAYVGAQKKYRLKVRLYCEYAYQAIFAKHLFRRPKKQELKNFKPDLTIYCAPSVTADPAVDRTNSEAFIILNVDKKTVLIGGTKYAGEIKKSVFSYMNYLLPQEKVFPMHCSANIGRKDNTVALFFGLSGTGKTTLSADTSRRLIGDDEHGWSPQGVFNFEGGCYAKCIRIRKESEPQIWSAIHRKESLAENVALTQNHEFDFDSDAFTENTRAVYPLDFISNSVPEGTGKHPKYVIFLTADASGCLPPVARLTLNQAAYHFLSGYTSKLAGTERGITEPKPTFSAYFGGPFMPLKPMVYLSLLKNYLKGHGTQVFLVNTGWVGGAYGTGHRISIKDTRAIVEAILSGELDTAECRHDPILNLYVPKSVKNVEDNILDPSFSWTNKNYYYESSKKLAKLFSENIKKFPGIRESIKNSGPKP